MSYMEYLLELEKAAEAITESEAKTVCIQLPDGLKPMAGEIKEKLEKMTGSNIIIWLGSCFGACDVPLQAESLGVDLLAQFGHSEWRS
jgi:diphthamide biosynthesis enzyme Dph1/Dph2-like protein